MRFLQPAGRSRFNEAIGFVVLGLGIALGLSLVSYHPYDPSWSVAGPSGRAHNLIGFPGAYLSDALLQWLGFAAFLLPLYLLLLGWRWVRSTPMPTPGARLVGALLLLLVACTALGLRPFVVLGQEAHLTGGVIGAVLLDGMVFYLNEAGATLGLALAGVVALYLVSSFEIDSGRRWWVSGRGWTALCRERWRAWRERQRERAAQKAEERGRRIRTQHEAVSQPLPDPLATRSSRPIHGAEEFEGVAAGEPDEPELPPIVPYEDSGAAQGGPPQDEEPPNGFGPPSMDEEPSVVREPRTYHLPSTLLLRPPYERGGYDPEELHEVARQVCAKFEEFGVGGTVTQINPGPVVTTFEFRPDPGIKYSRIVNLSEDLCLALECESIMVERIPGKSTIGIEVPNRKREIISLREVIESPDFTEKPSLLTMAVGKDINGRIKVSDLTAMPHVLVAGSTGSGKSVLINSIIMSILFKANPDQVRFILVDPKTVELGLYVDIPHLLTPVITDMKKASNALKNVTREMERRLKLLAEHGVRNLNQFNKKVDTVNAARQDDEPQEGELHKSEPLRKLPYIVIVIDELADLMMVEGRQIEESITRLAQMARAVGIHLILATQRPSVDVITGLIKANVPARISFRLATRVDSRTILDCMGAESLLGQGDMLFLPPASGRMLRLHGPLVTEEEIHAVVKAWKDQGEPDYENAFLAPPIEEAEVDGDGEAGFDDPVYKDAVRIVLDMGKASTSTLQRRLRLGYGRAARIIDAMERDGIIGPPDGSRPREVLKSPDWMAGVES